MIKEDCLFPKDFHSFTEHFPEPATNEKYREKIYARNIVLTLFMVFRARSWIFEYMSMLIKRTVKIKGSSVANKCTLQGLP
jgi:hypothetical protein